MNVNLFAYSPYGDVRQLMTCFNYDGQHGTREVIETHAVDEVNLQYREVQLGDGVVSIPFPPGGYSDDLMDQLLRANLTGTFQPLAGQGRRTVKVGEKTVFNILPRLIDLDIAQVRDLVESSEAAKLLLEGLPEAVAHSGPFEFEFEEDEIVRFAQLFSGQLGALEEFASLRDVDEPMWDDACTAARAILALHERDRFSNTPPKDWNDWVDRFKPIAESPGDEAYFLRQLDDPGVRQALQEDPTKVWTSLDVDGSEVVANGAHLVNRMGYYLCEVPYTGPLCDFTDPDEVDGDPDAPPASWGELSDRFEPIPLPVARNAQNMLRSSTDPELVRLAAQEPARIWTVLDVGGDERIVNGFHRGPGAAYLVCNVPYAGPDCEITQEDQTPPPRERG